MGLPDVHHKGRGGFEARDWRGSGSPVGIWELGGQIVEFRVRGKTGRPLVARAWPARLPGRRHKLGNVTARFLKKNVSINIGIAR